MPNLVPTKEQEKLLAEKSNCVVIARPGSGKTFTISQKIRSIVQELPHYQGVIAISFTNKASDELEKRCLYTGIDKKGSYFGTIDSFFITEIIIPFGKQVFGDPKREIQVKKHEDLENAEASVFLKDLKLFKGIDPNIIDSIRSLYFDGIIVLETVGFLGRYIFDASAACKRYLRAKYTHIFIDEYQDCDQWQHNLFMELIGIGLCGIAVGDIDQSIFAFAGKDPGYLASLAQDPRFVPYPLTLNHRCHISIVNYSTRLLSEKFEPTSTDDIRVLYKHVDGSEIEIANWLSEAIPLAAIQFGVLARNKVAVLVKSRDTGNIVHKNLTVAHKPIATTPLDNDSSLWGLVFRRILNWLFSPDITKHELVEKYLHIDYQTKIIREIMKRLAEIEAVAKDDPYRLSEHIPDFIYVANSIFPKNQNQSAIGALYNVLTRKVFLDSFIPANESEVQLMTLHKAKGLEFDMVFHLNLYKWILPQYKGNYKQDINLHYVGLTRAKKCCVLCTSSMRQNSNQEIVPAEPSEFLEMHDLENLRVPWNI